MINTYQYNYKNKTVKVLKDCTKCKHIKVCMFHKAISDVAEQNFMYRMNQYLESNNILRVFEIYGNCEQYSPQFIRVKGGTVPLDFDKEVISKILFDKLDEVKKALLEEKYPEHKDNLYFFFQPDYKIDTENDIFTVVLKTTNRDIGHGTVVYDGSFSISEILQNWTFE